MRSRSRPPATPQPSAPPAKRLQGSRSAQFGEHADRRTGPVRKVRRIAWQTYYHFNRDNGWVIAGYIAYMGLFALFPFLIFLLALAGFLGQSEAAMHMIGLGMDLLPSEVAAALRPAIDEVIHAPHAGLMTFGILITLWASSAGLESLRHALNLAYDVADRQAFWWSRLQSLLLTVLAAIIMVVAMVLVVVIPLVLNTVRSLLHKPDLGAVLYGAPRDSVGFLMLLGLLMLLYRVLPNVRLRAMEVVPGAVIAWILWLVAVWGYTIYLRTVPSYSVTYGSLGGIVVTLFFFYISALLFLLGAEINSVLKRRRENRMG